ncbi:MAG: DUF4062 domain-containing protein, partial [Chloroflexi bacterium]|nr:DUF4062 domain-containing protein [Chloroflexota bacterium]
SSKMRELAPERQALQDLLPALDRETFRLRTWAFEQNAPASNKSIRDVYLEALQNSALYVGLFWNDFGEWTIDEFEQATAWGIERHLCVKTSVRISATPPSRPSSNARAMSASASRRAGSPMSRT